MKSALYRRVMLILSLTAILAGTPLRLAEAADDLEQSLSESAFESGIEVADGGVGDDSGVSIRSAVFESPGASGSFNLMPTLFTLVALPSKPVIEVTVSPPSQHWQSLLRRHLLLLCFLC
jgi:hypothetical protein